MPALIASSKETAPVKYAAVPVSRSAAKDRKHVKTEYHIRIYTVKKGDTAYSIAAANYISVDRLCQANNLSPKAVLRSGQNLRIPAQASGDQEKAKLAIYLRQ